MTQPKTETNDLALAIREFEAKLPGWWWTVGCCRLTRHASCGPDRQGDDRHLLTLDTFDAGFHCDDMNGSAANALRSVMEQGLKAKAEFGFSSE